MHKTFKTKEGKKREVEFAKYNYNNVLNPEFDQKQILFEEFNSILKDCWGSFPSNFIEKHIFDEKCRIIVARHINEFIGFCVLSFKKVCGVDVHYIEFLAIKKKFQGFGLGPYLFYLILSDDIKRNFFKLLFKPLEIFFITPNIRTITQISRCSKFIYPNPYLARDDGSIDAADENTWEIAKEIISNSDNPHRKLHREGLVLEGSYAETPWLIYGPENAPWAKDPQVIKFVKKYLGYHNKEDKELVVRAHITLGSVVKYLFSNK